MRLIISVTCYAIDLVKKNNGLLLFRSIGKYLAQQFFALTKPFTKNLRATDLIELGISALCNDSSEHSLSSTRWAGKENPLHRSCSYGFKFISSPKWYFN